MTTAYEIARYDVRTEKEVLIERARVFIENGGLRCRVDDGQETVCSDSDVIAVIGANRALNEVRANQAGRRQSREVRV